MDGNQSLTKRIHVLILIVVSSLIIVLVGYFYYQYSAREIRNEKQQDLQSIAKLKVQQVKQWITERESEFAFFSQNPALINYTVSELENKPDSYLKEHVLDRIMHIKKNHGYKNIFLVSKEKSVLFSVDSVEAKFNATINHFINKTFKTKAFKTTGFYIPPQRNTPLIDFISPVTDNQNQLIGALIFRVDPSKHLYPLIQSWPGRSETSETVLVRQKGDSVFFLNELRFHKNSALNLSVSLKKTDLPAVKAIMGYKGIWEGKDYRHHEVLAYIQPITNTPWFLITKVDKSEIYANLYTEIVYITIAVFLGIFLVTFAISFIYSHRQKNIYKRLAYSQAEFSTTLESIGDAVIATDVQGYVQYLNPVAESLTGWKLSKAIRRPLEDVFKIINEYSRETVPTPVKKILAEGTKVGLANHTLLISREGSEVPIADSGAPIKDEKGKINGVVLVFRDQTEEREHQKKLEESRARYSTIFHESPIGALYFDKNGTILDCNEKFVQIIGSSREKLIGFNMNKSVQNKKLRNAVIDALTNGYGEFEGSYNSVTADKESYGRAIFKGIRDKNGNINTGIGLIEDTSKQKDAEEALRKSEEKYKSLFDNDAAVKLLFDPDSQKIVDANEAATNFYGWSKEKLISMTLSDISNHTYDQIRATIEKVIKRERFFFEFKHKIANGEVRDVEVYRSPIDIGNKTFVHSIIHDITERKRAEQQLNLLYQSIKESPVSVIIADENGKIEYANPKVCELTGYSMNELLGSTPRIFNSGEHSKEFFEELWKTILSGNDWKGEIKNKTKDGEYYWESATISPIKDNNGTITHFVAVKEDITEWKKNQNALNYYADLQKLLIRIALNYINIPLQDVDEGIEDGLAEIGRFVNADRAYVFEYDFKNNTTTNTHEWCREGITPQKEHLRDVSLNSITDWVKAHKNGENVYIYDTKQVKDDRLRDILKAQDIKSLYTTPMVYKDECIGFMGFDSVVSHRHYTETERQLVEVFAQIIVNIKNRYQVENDLIEAKENAEESNRLKSAFLANMNHEIRTPMNGIMGFTDLLKDPALTGDEKLQYIQMIEKSGNRMLGTINDLIDISKIEAGQTKLYIKKMAVNDKLDELYEFFKLEAEQKHLDLYLEKDEPELMLNTDADKLMSVLTNLIKNAIKFTPEGFIKFGYKSRTNDYLFYVEDTGIGIPEGKRKDIFERFIQVDNSHQRSYQGSGLGLSITKAYVEMLGGNIWLQSEMNKGTNFYFTIPSQISAQENNIAEGKTNSKPNEKEMVPSDKLVILVVEDDEASYLYLYEVLKNISTKIIQAGTGIEALEVFEKNRDIDFVLMDIQLPEMDGLEVTRRIREKDKQVKIIAQTAYAMKGDSTKALNAGCDDYIAKPIKQEALLEMLRKHANK